MKNILTIISLVFVGLGGLMTWGNYLTQSNLDRQVQRQEECRERYIASFAKEEAAAGQRSYPTPAVATTPTDTTPKPESAFNRMLDTLFGPDPDR